MSNPRDERPDSSEEESGGQVSEVSAMSGEAGDAGPAGGADATDKSTGTAPDEAEEPSDG